MTTAPKVTLLASEDSPGDSCGNWYWPHLQNVNECHKSQHDVMPEISTREGDNPYRVTSLSLKEWVGQKSPLVFKETSKLQRLFVFP